MIYKNFSDNVIPENKALVFEIKSGFDINNLGGNTWGQTTTTTSTTGGIDINALGGGFGNTGAVTGTVSGTVSGTNTGFDINNIGGGNTWGQTTTTTTTTTGGLDVAGLGVAGTGMTGSTGDIQNELAKLTQEVKGVHGDLNNLTNSLRASGAIQ